MVHGPSGQHRRPDGNLTVTIALDIIRERFSSVDKGNLALFSTKSRGACPEYQGLGYLTLVQPLDILVDGERQRLLANALGGSARGCVLHELTTYLHTDDVANLIRLITTAARSWSYSVEPTQRAGSIEPALCVYLCSAD